MLVRSGGWWGGRGGLRCTFKGGISDQMNVSNPQDNWINEVASFDQRGEKKHAGTGAELINISIQGRKQDVETIRLTAAAGEREKKIA